MRRFIIPLTAAVIAVLLSATSFAQSPTPNIATSATASHSGGGTGNYAPDQYNNGLITANPTGCPGTAPYPWGWTRTGNGQNGSNYWIQFEWSSPQTFGEMTFYHAYTCRRQLGGADIQAWNGSSWVTVHSFTFQPPWDIPVRTIQFPPTTTSRVRITNMLIVGNAGQQISNPAFREIEIRNICTDPPTDVTFSASPTTTQPDPIAIDYSVGRPIGQFTATITMNFKTPGGTLVHSESTTVEIDANTVTGTYHVSSSQIPPGFYLLEVVFNVLDICNDYTDVTLKNVIMVLAPGQTACTVWPGDVNNDLIVNFGDRKALNTYIHDANLSPIWLSGPARYRVDAQDDPLTFIRWEGQPSVPWATPEGCYMDADGNGTVNNFDFIPIKMNWMRDHGIGPDKSSAEFNAMTFDLDQNFPNPFNPSTKIQYSVPERSHVNLVVMDVTGREVAELVNGTIEAGVHTVTFDATGLSSGIYLGVATMQGLKSDLSFNKTIRMTLAK